MPRHSKSYNTPKKSIDNIVPMKQTNSNELSVPNNGLQKSTFGQTVKDGFAFGIGSSVANILTRSIFSSNTEKSSEVVKVEPYRDYKQCMIDTDYNHDVCMHLKKIEK